MKNLKLNYAVTAKYENDDSSAIRFKDRKSPKNGSSFRQFLEEMESFFLELNRDQIVRLYVRGNLDWSITNGRKVFLDTKGNLGLSRTEALKRYKMIYSNLPKEVLEKRNQTFDNFTEKELGLKE